MKSLTLPLLIVCFLIAVHAAVAAKPRAVKVAVPSLSNYLYR